jgi:hypothetical protein
VSSLEWLLKLMPQDGPARYVLAISIKESLGPDHAPGLVAVLDSWACDEPRQLPFSAILGMPIIERDGCVVGLKGSAGRGVERSTTMAGLRWGFGVMLAGLLVGPLMAAPPGESTKAKHETAKHEAAKAAKPTAEEQALEGRGLKRTGLHFALADEEEAVLRDFPTTREEVGKLLQARAKIEAMMGAQMALQQQEQLVQGLRMEAAQAEAAIPRAPAYGRYARLQRHMEAPGRERLREIQATERVAQNQERAIKANQPTAKDKTAATKTAQAAEVSAKAAVETLKMQYEAVQSHYRLLNEDEEVRKLVETYAVAKHAAYRVGPSKEFEEVGRFLAKFGGKPHEPRMGAVKPAEGREAGEKRKASEVRP